MKEMTATPFDATWPGTTLGTTSVCSVVKPDIRLYNAGLSPTTSNPSPERLTAVLHHRPLHLHRPVTPSEILKSRILES